MKTFYLPDLGEGLTEAEIREWYVKEGETITLDEPMVSVETAKAVVDIPAPSSGVLLKRFGEPGELVRTGSPMAEFKEAYKTTGTVVGIMPQNDTLMERLSNLPRLDLSHPSNYTTTKATPAVRALAKQLNVNLDTITPSREDGVITPDDVKQAAAATTTNSAYNTEILKGAKRHMAITLSQAHSAVVPVTLTDEAIVHHWKVGEDITQRLIEAIITACQAEPALNGHFCGKTLTHTRYDTIHLGIAMDTPHGLYLPVLKSVETQQKEQWRTQINAFKTMAAQQAFNRETLREATIVLSNFGSIGGRYATPMVVPPTVAIIGVGRLYDNIVAIDNKPVVRRCLPISLTVDHRAITGGEAARFINCFVNTLSQDDI